MEDFFEKLNIRASFKSRAKSFNAHASTVGTLRMSAAVIADRFRRKLIFYQQDLKRPFPEAAPMPGLVWRRVRADEANLLAAVNPSLNKNVAEKQLAQGQIGWVFFINDQPVHYRWEVTVKVFINYLGASMALGEKEIMHHSGYTRREYRRQGISTFCRSLLLAKARDRGCHRVIVAVAWWNWPSLTSCRYKSRLQPLGSVVRWGVGPFSKLWTAGDMAINGQNELCSKMSHVVLPKDSIWSKRLGLDRCLQGLDQRSAFSLQ